MACEDYIQRALRISPYFQRGLELQNLIRSRLQDEKGEQDYSNIVGTALDEPITDEVSNNIKEVLLDDLSWLSLGEQLLEEYKVLLTDTEKEFYNRRIVITAKAIQSEDAKMDEDPKGDEPSVTTEGEAAAEESVFSEARATLESCVQDSAEPSVPIPTCGEETAEQGDKDGAETEQSAAIKRKRKEFEERSGLRYIIGQESCHCQCVLSFYAH